MNQHNQPYNENIICTHYQGSEEGAKDHFIDWFNRMRMCWEMDMNDEFDPNGDYECADYDGRSIAYAVGNGNCSITRGTDFRNVDDAEHYIMTHRHRGGQAYAVPYRKVELKEINGKKFSINKLHWVIGGVCNY